MGVVHLYLAAKLIACFSILYLFGLLTSRVAFHPLHKYPGPLLAKLTDAYGGIYAIRKSYHYAVQRHFEKYGDVVRVGPNRLVFNTKAALHDIYQNPTVNKPPLFMWQRALPQATTFDSVDVEEHRRKRKAISQPISDRRLRGFEPAMIGKIDEFISLMKGFANSSEPVDMTTWTRHLATDVISLIAFGSDLKILTEETNHWLLPWLITMTYRMNVLINFPKAKSIATFIMVLFTSTRRHNIRALMKVLHARVAEGKNAKKDFYSTVADHMKVGKTLLDSEVWTEAFLYLSAGGATVSSGMSAMFFYLSRYPKCYTKLADEIRSVYTTADEIKWDEKLRSCSYLRACINESLRIAPPNPTISWRAQMDRDEKGHLIQEPFVVDGHVIPPGTNVGVNLYAIGHNEKYWPDPYTFKPERWIEADEELLHSGFSAFGLGARVCAGKAMAYQEISLLFARVMLQLDFEPALGKLGQVGEAIIDGKVFPDRYYLEDMFTAGHSGPNLIFRDRTRAA